MIKNDLRSSKKQKKVTTPKNDFVDVIYKNPDHMDPRHKAAEIKAYKKHPDWSHEYAVPVGKAIPAEKTIKMISVNPGSRSIPMAAAGPAVGNYSPYGMQSLRTNASTDHFTSAPISKFKKSLGNNKSPYGGRGSSHAAQTAKDHFKSVQFDKLPKPSPINLDRKVK